MKRDFIELSSLTLDELEKLLKLASRLKRDLLYGFDHPYLRGKTLAMIFEKPSLRTRITFETGMAQLGGHAIYLGPQEVGLGRREAVKDVARNLSRWVDAIMIRTFAHSTCLDMAREADVPVINGLTDTLHPCQLLADLLTLYERFGNLKKLRVAFVGDGFNLANSWIEASELVGFELRMACPQGYEPKGEFRERLQRNPRALLVNDPIVAVNDADVVYTDAWVSMGQEDEAEKRRRDFRAFQVNRELLKHAKATVLVMHCLPAHRGEEITDDVIDGPNSIVLDQAENRLHAQKALLLWLLRPEILNE